MANATNPPPRAGGTIFRRHWILTSIAGVFLFLLLVLGYFAFSGPDTRADALINEASEDLDDAAKISGVAGDAFDLTNTADADELEGLVQDDRDAIDNAKEQARSAKEKLAEVEELGADESQLEEAETLSRSADQWLSGIAAFEKWNDKMSGSEDVLPRLTQAGDKEAQADEKLNEITSLLNKNKSTEAKTLAQQTQTLFSESKTLTDQAAQADASLPLNDLTTLLNKEIELASLDVQMADSANNASKYNSLIDRGNAVEAEIEDLKDKGMDILADPAAWYAEEKNISTWEEKAIDRFNKAEEIESEATP